MRAKIAKITHRAAQANMKGLWMVWCQVYVNGNYRYTALEFDTPEAAREIKEGQIVEFDKL